VKQFRPQHNGKSGYSFVEVLVVITILSILWVMSVAAVRRYRKISAGRVAEANARTAYIAVKAAEALNGNFTVDLPPDHPDYEKTRRSRLTETALRMMDGTEGEIDVISYDDASGSVTVQWSGDLQPYKNVTSTVEESENGLIYWNSLTGVQTDMVRQDNYY